MITQVRNARPAIMMNGTDYYQSLAPYLLSLSYTDNCDGQKADDLNMDLADRDKRFINDWMPEKGAFIDVEIIANNWFAPFAAGISLDCGRFWIDSIQFTLPDHTVSVKATSIPTAVRLKQSKETRGWEKTTLQDIAQQIAEDSHMEVDFQSDVNPKYKRTEMHDESPLAFLKKRANNAKLAIKVVRNKIVIFDEQKLEEEGPKFSLLYGNTAATNGLAAYRMSGGSFSTKITDTTKKAKCSHIDIETGEVKSGEHTAEDENGDGEDDETDDKAAEDTDTDDDDGGGGDGETRELETQSDASSGASLKAKSICRDKNKKKDTATVEMSIGNPLIAAGMTFNLVGCGQFDGTWFIESALHKVGPEYTTSLGIRKCLKGY